MNDLKLDFKDLSERSTGPMIPFNPHIQYYEGEGRGYFAATLTPKRMQLDVRFVTSVENPNGTGCTERTW